MPRGGDRGGRNPGIWKNQGDMQSMVVPRSLKPSIKAIALALDKEQFDEAIALIEALKQKQS